MTSVLHSSLQDNSIRPIITLDSSEENECSGRHMRYHRSLTSPDLLSSPSRPKSRPAPRLAQHSQNSSSSTSHSSTPVSAFGITPVDGNRHLSLSRTVSNDSQRSSGEYTAVTIYSMYSESPRASILLGASDLPYSSRTSHSRAQSRASSKLAHDSIPLSEKHRPSIDHAAVDSRRSSYYSAQHSVFIEESPDEQPYVDGPTSPFYGTTSSSAPSPHSQLSINQPQLPADTTQQPTDTTQQPSTSGRDMNRLLVPPKRTSSASPSPGSRGSRSSAALPVVQGEGEDGDSLYVRSTYARLEQTGVPGDGYEEGVERTRARSIATSSDKRRHTVWNADPEEISQKEIEFLSTLDRYGFVATPVSGRQENRLALLPVVPLRKLLITSRPVRTPPSSPSLPSAEISGVPPPREPPKERRRVDKWERMMKVSKRDQGGNIEQWTFDEKKGRKLRERVYKGIPDRWRAAVWWTLIERATLDKLSPPNPSDSSKRLSAADLIRQYWDRVDLPSTYDIQIDLDVPRTISGHVMFHTRYGQGQRSLFHVLHTFAQLCPECGYCQGMGPIAATLLCYLEPERVYASLVRIHDSYDMHAIFSPGFPGLLESIYVQEKIVEKLLPDVYAAFKKHMISTTSYATKWYITLFANTFPFQTQLRLWDSFLLEGRDVMVIIAVAIIWVLKDHLSSAQATFETILSLLSSFFVSEEEDALLLWIGKALGDKRLRSDMILWRSEWREMVKSGKDRTALL